MGRRTDRRPECDRQISARTRRSRRTHNSINMPSIRDLADKHPALLRGDRKETEDRLSAVEKALHVYLPPDVRWLLLECGYGAVHAVSNIQESVDDTLRFRASAGLDPRYVVLDDKGDAGVVLLDTSNESGPVVWADWRSAGLVHSGSGVSELFDSFSAWVEDRILELGDE